MDDTLSAVIKEAFSTNPSNEVYLRTISLSHTLVTPSIYLVADRRNWDLDLEDAGGTKTFEAVAFRLDLPGSGDQGLQELTLEIDNVDDRMTDFVNLVKASKDETTITFRIYMASDVTAPQNDPPLSLVLKDIVITPDGVFSGRATFADLINKPFLTEYYTRARFPSLAN